MAAPVKRVERSSSFSETPKAPEPDIKKRAVDHVIPTPVSFPGLLEVKNGITVRANSHRPIDLETFLDMIQRETLPILPTELSAHMAAQFFAAEAICALATLQSIPALCPSFVKSYFKWEAVAAKHVTHLYHDINLDSATCMTAQESALLRFLPLCKKLRFLQLNISGRFADGAVMLASVQRMLEKLPSQVREIRLSIDMNECSDQHPWEFAKKFDSLFLSLISCQQLCDLELDVTSRVDWQGLLESNDLPKMISRHAYPFQLKITERDVTEKKNGLFYYKHVKKKEWEACAEHYNDMVADPQQTQAYSLLIANKLFPNSSQLAPVHIGIAVDNEVLAQWPSLGFLTDAPPINPSIKQGVIWCQFRPTPLQ